MGRIAPLAVITGAIIDWVLTATLELPLSMYVLFSRHLQRLPRDEMQKVLLHTMHDEPALYALRLTVGFACTLIGSIIAGVLAKRAQVLNGVLSAMLPTILGVVTLVRGTYVGKTWQALVWLFVVTPIVGAAGGWLAERMQSGRSESPA
jgi:hypothetical protein